MTDREYLDSMSRIEILCEILLAYLRYVPVKNYTDEIDYYKKLNKSLKFQNLDDHDLFRSCIDILEDTEIAINDVRKNGLSKTGNLPERYLKLIGVLNCYYIQLNAITDLLKLFNIQNQKNIIQNLKESELIQIRNKIASHTTAYLSDINLNERLYYRILRTSLNSDGNRIEIFSKKGMEHINLPNLMNELSYQFEVALFEIVENRIKNYNFKKEHKDWLNIRFEYLNENCS